MNLRTQKRIAAAVLGIGETRVWVDPEKATDIAQAMTREDVRELIKQGLIQEKTATKPTRAIAKKRRVMRKKRKGVGHGKRSGSSGARSPTKTRWVKRMRSQRRFIRLLKEKGAIDTPTHRKYYRQIKGGRFTSIRNLKELMKTEGALK
jgi:large subunit ribosomal protein L19e